MRCGREPGLREPDGTELGVQERASHSRSSEGINRFGGPMMLSVNLESMGVPNRRYRS